MHGLQYCVEHLSVSTRCLACVHLPTPGSCVLWISACSQAGHRLLSSWTDTACAAIHACMGRHGCACDNACLHLGMTMQGCMKATVPGSVLTSVMGKHQPVIALSETHAISQQLSAECATAQRSKAGNQRGNAASRQDSSRPVSMLKVVVLPAPFTPSRPKHSPSGMPSQSPSTALTGGLKLPWLYCFSSPFSSTCHCCCLLPVSTTYMLSGSAMLLSGSAMLLSGSVMHAVRVTHAAVRVSHACC